MFDSCQETSEKRRETHVCQYFSAEVYSCNKNIPSGNQNMAGKWTTHRWFSLLKPPFIGDVPLPCLISTGYSMLGWKGSCSDDAKHVFWCRSPEAAEEIVKLKGENQAGARSWVDDDLGILPMGKSTTSMDIFHMLVISRGYIDDYYANIL